MKLSSRSHHVCEPAPGASSGLRADDPPCAIPDQMIAMRCETVVAVLFVSLG